MNIQELRQSLKQKWLYYYQENCHWLEKMQIWAVFDGERRPLSSFVLATVSILEPNLVDILPLLVDLNTNPDDMIAALGLNFNPENELKKLNNDNDNLSGTQVIEETSYKHPRNKCDSRDVKDLSPNPSPTRRGEQEQYKDTHPSLRGKGVGGLGSKDDVKNQNLKSEQIIHITPNNSLQHQMVLGAIEYTASKNNNILLAVKTSCQNEIKSLQPVALLTQTSIQNKAASKNYKLGPEIQDKVNQLSTINRRKLANWIDEFCQGRDWDKDESTFIPF
ncbi:MAG: DUF5331 domain-containing protein [Calothrix sp. FI2-JRJ7]|jgi:hypothetical protein|nr:DUF5331 domain-containing protein [Calothrix sp. FI2-JRJ7]